MAVQPRGWEPLNDYRGKWKRKEGRAGNKWEESQAPGVRRRTSFTPACLCDAPLPRFSCRCRERSQKPPLRSVRASQKNMHADLWFSSQMCWQVRVRTKSPVRLRVHLAVIIAAVTSDVVIATGCELFTARESHIWTCPFHFRAAAHSPDYVSSSLAPVPSLTPPLMDGCTAREPSPSDACKQWECLRFVYSYHAENRRAKSASVFSKQFGCTVISWYLEKLSEDSLKITFQYRCQIECKQTVQRQRLLPLMKHNSHRQHSYANIMPHSPQMPPALSNMTNDTTMHKHFYSPFLAKLTTGMMVRSSSK